MAKGAEDANGVYQYGEDDVADGTESGIHNLGQANLSALIGDIRPMLNTVWMAVPGRHANIADFGGNFAPLTYRRRNGDVQVRGTGNTNANIAAGATLFTLPTGFRPSHSHRFWGIVGSSPAIFEVRATGVVISSATIPSGGSWSIDGFQFGAAA